MLLANNPALLFLASPVILRLTLLPGRSIPGLPALLHCCVLALERLETSMDLTRSGQTSAPQKLLLVPPHRAPGLRELDGSEDLVQSWGDTVACLWRVSMTLEVNPATWDFFTRRLLIWRAVRDEEGTGIGEWARSQVVLNLAM